MMKKFAVLTIFLGLVAGSSFAMEDFESGNLVRIRAICTEKIQEFEKKDFQVANKFDCLLLLCLNDDSFNRSLSDGSYFKAFEEIKPYLQSSEKSDSKRGASGGQKPSFLGVKDVRRGAHAQWLALRALEAQKDREALKGSHLGLSDDEFAEAFQAELNRQGGREAPAEDPDARFARELQRQFDAERGAESAQLRQAAPLGVLERIRENPHFDDMRRQIGPVVTHIKSLPRMADVHVLDGYVEANLASVVAVGRTLEVGDPDLSFEKVQADMKTYFQSNPIKLQLNGANLPLATFLGYVDAVFQADFKGQSDMFRELVSRTWTFAREVHSTGQEGDRFLTDLASGIAENYVARGGCLKGRMNRFFATYVRMLDYAMNPSQ